MYKRQYRNRDTGTASLDVTERLSAGTLILPLFHEMTESEQSRVIDAVAASGRKR